MRFKVLLAVAAVVFLFAGCAKDQVAERRAKYYNEAERQKFAVEHDLNRLPPSDVPLVLNDRVLAWMDYFQGAGRSHFERYLERSGRYIKMMRDVLKQNGLPQDLVYVALIESGFNNNAYSRAAAVGPWQFIRGTGSRYGLDINGWVDERRNPVKATWAAAHYLKDLHDEFGDWYLAMAGYNAGEGRIRDAVANSGSKNFWDIADADERHLRAETRDYVPKFIAATIIAKMPQNFGFTGINYQKPLEFDVVTVETQTDLNVIADCASVGTDTIADLNPHLVRGSTPPGARHYEINLPKGTVPTFKTKYAQVPETERVKMAYHKVRRGESVATIARRYGISKSALLASNDISMKRKLRPGTMLVIPRGAAVAAYADDSNYDNKDERVVKMKKLVSYRVKKMDSVSRIANKFGVTPGQVKSWNLITTKNPLRVGRVIKIYQAVYVSKAGTKKDRKQIAMASETESQQHSIQAGESLWAIAQRYGMSVDELAAINELDAGSKIKPGQKITIRQKEGKTVIEASPAPEAQDVKKEEGRPVPEVQVSKETSGDGQSENMTIAKAAASEASPDDIDLSVKDQGQPETAGPSTKLGAGKKTVTVSKSYKVKKGESLNVVAKRNGVTVVDLMKWNGIKNPKVVRAGQVLKIKTTAMRSTEAPRLSSGQAKKPTAAPAVIVNPSKVQPPNDIKEEGAPLKLSDIPLPEQQSGLDYKVRDGDTLWDIARRHKVTIAEIQKWNNLSDPSAVKPGDSLAIHK